MKHKHGSETPAHDPGMHSHEHRRPALPVLTLCPACGQELRVARLACGACGTAVEGNFSLGRMARLTREQFAFVEAFIRCRGKIKDVEQALGLSYPTVVSRLDDVVRAMGFEVDPVEAERAARRQRVLDELADGKINAQEAASKLRALSGGEK